MMTPDEPPPAIVEMQPAFPALSWRQLPSLPQGNGVGGPYVGVLGGRLMIAGGAAFPDGQTKVFVDRLHLLERDEDESLRWVAQDNLKLPRPAGYGATVPDEEGVILIGGMDDRECFAEVTRISPAGSMTLLAPLPVPLANFAAARVGPLLIVAGGQESPTGPATRHCFALDLSADPASWRILPPWPGKPRVAPVGVALDDEFILLGGRDSRPGEPTVVLTDAYAFSPVSQEWRRLPDVPPSRDNVNGVMAATGVPLDNDRLIVLGGGAGAFLERRERLLAKAAELQREKPSDEGESAGDAELAALRHELAHLNHPGFQRTVRVYDRRTERWLAAEVLPMELPPVTTTAVWWNDLIVLPTGEIRPQGRTETIWAGTIEVTPQR
jgi:N-acetylneuraminic acid mutarotase